MIGIMFQYGFRNLVIQALFVVFACLHIKLCFVLSTLQSVELTIYLTANIRQ